MSHNITIRLTSIAALLCLVLTSSCAEPPRDPTTWPADPETGRPAINWPNGEPDLTNEWVNALQHSLTSFALADNSSDFSSDYLAEYNTPEMIEEAAWGLTEYIDAGTPEGSYLYYMPGPWPFTVNKVRTRGDTTNITVCQAIEWRVYYPLSTPATPPSPERLEGSPGRVFTYTLTRDESTGLLQYSDFKEDAKGCELTDVQPGYFDPEPDYARVVTRADIIGPDGTQPYVP